MLKIVLIRPGSTDFDVEGRIRGTLDVPLNRHGTEQVARTIDELSCWQFDAIFTSPVRGVAPDGGSRRLGWCRRLSANRK